VNRPFARLQMPFTHARVKNTALSRNPDGCFWGGFFLPKQIDKKLQEFTNRSAFVEATPCLLRSGSSASRQNAVMYQVVSVVDMRV